MLGPERLSETSVIIKKVVGFEAGEGPDAERHSDANASTSPNAPPCAKPMTLPYVLTLCARSAMTRPSSAREWTPSLS